MRYIAAYLLLQTGGNANPSAADIQKLLSTVGIESDSARLDKLLAELSGKDVSQVSNAAVIRCCVLWNANSGSGTVDR